MAVTIKDGNGGTDQVGVLPVSKSLKVTLVDAAGNINATPLATSTTGALELNGNLADIRLSEDQTTGEMLRLILIELRLQNEILANGLNLSNEQYETNYRNDRAFTKTDTVNT
jgi:hypothetical protein